MNSCAILHMETHGAEEGVISRSVAPRGRFITADDLIEAFTPRTRAVP
jgi:hypothetical protein